MLPVSHTSLPPGTSLRNYGSSDQNLIAIGKIGKCASAKVVQLTTLDRVEHVQDGPSGLDTRQDYIVRPLRIHLPRAFERLCRQDDTCSGVQSSHLSKHRDVVGPTQKVLGHRGQDNAGLLESGMLERIKMTDIAIDNWDIEPRKCTMHFR